MLNLTHDEKWLVLKNKAQYPELSRIVESQNKLRFDAGAKGCMKDGE